MSTNYPIIHNIIRRESGLDAANNFQSKLYKDRLSISKNLFKRDLLASFGCVNAIEFSKEGDWLISGGDDRRVLIWNIHKSILNREEPCVMLKQHLSNIFCLSFDNKNSRIFSGGNDDMVIVHDIATGDCVDVFYHTKPVYGLGVDPFNENLFATAGEDGRVLLFDLRASNSDAKTIVKYRAPFHSVMFHPVDSNFMITANAKEGAALWDNRSQRMPLIRYGGDDASQSCMSVRFNRTGTLLLALRRRLPPILYSTVDQEPICQFYNQDYYNSCTMKSCTFAGPYDEYVCSGSDDFNLYVWNINEADLESRHQWVDKNQMILYGHRSIVNQVRYNPQRCLLASSGVEKIIKLWTPFELDNWTGSLLESHNDNIREVFTHEEYISLVHANGQNMSHDYTNQNTNEDPRMIAFFDYLVQQEIEGWSDRSNQSSDHTSENSLSRPGSPTSDTEPNNTNFNTVKTVHRCRDVHRRGETSQRHKYRNRIAYLIATKRKSLKRLALKRFTRNATTARRMKGKYVPRQTKRAASMRTLCRKPYDKKMRRLSVQSKYKKPVSHEQTSDSEVPQKTKKRRHQSYNANSSYRSFRRKAKSPLSSSNTSTRAADKSDSSSDYYDDEDENETTRNVPPTVSAPPMLDIPSTSTGITANGFLFRIAATNHDSDDDDDDDVQDQSVNDGASTSMQFRNGYATTRHNNNHLNNNNQHHENGRRKYRNQDDEHEDYASTTNISSMLSSSTSDSSSNDSYPDYFCKKRKLNNGAVSFKLNDGASTSKILSTPVKTQDDSGIGPSSSSSSKGSKIPNGNTSFESFKKIEEVKRNYRKNMQTSDDSD